MLHYLRVCSNTCKSPHSMPPLKKSSKGKTFIMVQLQQATKYPAAAHSLPYPWQIGRELEKCKTHGLR